MVREHPGVLGEAAFVERFGGVYEHSPWIAQAAYRAGLPEDADTAAGLARALRAVVDGAGRDRLMGLILAHPDLAGKAAIAGELTAESSAEQAGAGIAQCTPEEFQRFTHYNAAYRERFGFPFIMAVKGSNRHAILAAFERRLQNDLETEFETAIGEIHKIARFRLEVLFGEGFKF